MSAPDPAQEKQEVVTFSDVAKEFMQKARREGRASATLDKNEWLLDVARADFDQMSIREIDAATVLKSRSTTWPARKCKATALCHWQRLPLCGSDYAGRRRPTFALQGALTCSLVRPSSSRDGSKSLRSAIAGDMALRWTSGNLCGAEALGDSCPWPGELRQSLWSEFNMEAAIWTVPASRAKMRRPHHVPLGSLAITIISDLKGASRSPSLVYPSIKSANLPISENALNAALRRMG